MKQYKYIIIGGGMTGSSAVMGIRKNDQAGTIAMFSDEIYPPYNRPPLTKGLWDGKSVDDIVRPMEKYNIDLYLNTKVVELNPQEKWIATKDGQKYQYQKLLLASGGDPIHLPDAPDGLIYYRTRADYEQLQRLTQSKDKFCVIGGGFIGSEIAAALAKQGKDVSMIFPEIGISGLRFPDDLAEFLNDYYRENDVKVHNGYLADSISKVGDQFQVVYKSADNGETTEETFDAVIVGIGIKPNTTLAEEAGLSVDDGVLVNKFLQTDDPDIFAAGDVCRFEDVALGEKIRVEHEDNANTMGMHAGLNMSGELEKYDHQPFFYSDLFDLGYEAVGELDKNYDIVEDWIEPFKKGTIYYLDNGKVRGVIFWNLWGKVDDGRELIRKGKTYQREDLLGMFS